MVDISQSLCMGHILNQGAQIDPEIPPSLATAACLEQRKRGTARSETFQSSKIHSFMVQNQIFLWQRDSERNRKPGSTIIVFLGNATGNVITRAGRQEGEGAQLDKSVFILIQLMQTRNFSSHGLRRQRAFLATYRPLI